MTAAQEGLVLLSAAVGAGNRPRLRRALEAAATVTDGTAIEEVLVQSYLFVGYPAALGALGEWRRFSGRPAAAPAGDETEWERRGVATCRRVYGGQYERLRDNIRALHPDMEAWMVVEGYGKVLGRPGLDLATRELCIVALLAQQDAAPQLYSHLRGALNAGNTEADVEAMISLLLPDLAEPRRGTLRQQWAAVQQRRSTAGN
ncbi:MAG TPA: carboxymuconolactone decarboxylase family protein [Longimicrobiales bacterium]|nr:carboxymuconolactone decarboxylase family protein [Longimicrobiales bacterium]